jgi:hypothetical protein
MRKYIDIISESNHCSVKFDDIEDDTCSECGMHKEWHRGLDAETMERSAKYARDVEARGKMFADRKKPSA